MFTHLIVQLTRQTQTLAFLSRDNGLSGFQVV